MASTNDAERDVREACSELRYAMGNPIISGTMEQTLRGQTIRTAIEQLRALLPCSYYLDPPDGGEVPLFECLRRMSEDAAKWREYISSPLPTSERFSVTPHHLCGNPAGCYTAPQLCDACLNAAGN